MKYTRTFPTEIIYMANFSVKPPLKQQNYSKRDY